MAAIEKLTDHYDGEKRGIELRKVAGGYTLRRRALDRGRGAPAA